MTLKARLRSWVKHGIRAAGYDIHRLHPADSAGHQLHLAFERFGIDLVFDVGANVGQFSESLRFYGYTGKIVSFEPLSVAREKLTEAAARDPKWEVHPRVALGENDGEVDINVSGNLFSSSILPMLEGHKAAASDSVYVGVERVPITRLDAVAEPYLREAKAPFLKIDTQGFEQHVLDGASGILPRLRGVLCELSLVPLYEGQPLWMEMLARLEADGFTLWAIQPGFTDYRDGRTLQFDAIWFRT